MRFRELAAKALDATFWKFVLVGVVNTLFGTAVMFGAYNLLHWGYWPSTAANYVLGSILSYVLNRRFTFRYQGDGVRSVVRFAVNVAVCYAVAYGAARPLVSWVLSNVFAGTSPTLRDNVAMLAGMCLFVAVNYIGQRFFVFRARGGGSPQERRGDGPDASGNRGRGPSRRPRP